MNDLGPGMCALDSQCKGARLCSVEGTCTGYSICADTKMPIDDEEEPEDDEEKPEDLCAIDEKLNYFGPHQCESDDECRGDRKCDDEYGKCVGEHNCKE